MIQDTIIYIDDSRFCEAQYQGGNELYLVGLNCRDVIVFDVSEKTFLELQRDPSAEKIRQILLTHRWAYAS